MVICCAPCIGRAPVLSVGLSLWGARARCGREEGAGRGAWKMLGRCGGYAHGRVKWQPPAGAQGARRRERGYDTMKALVPRAMFC